MAPRQKDTTLEPLSQNDFYAFPKAHWKTIRTTNIIFSIDIHRESPPRAHLRRSEMGPRWQSPRTNRASVKPSESVEMQASGVLQTIHDLCETRSFSIHQHVHPENLDREEQPHDNGKRQYTYTGDDLP